MGSEIANRDRASEIGRKFLQVFVDVRVKISHAGMYFVVFVSLDDELSMQNPRIHLDTSIITI